MCVHVFYPGGFITQHIIQAMGTDFSRGERVLVSTGTSIAINRKLSADMLGAVFPQRAFSQLCVSQWSWKHDWSPEGKISGLNLWRSFGCSKSFLCSHTCIINLAVQIRPFRKGGAYQAATWRDPVSGPHDVIKTAVSEWASVHAFSCVCPECVD